MNTFALPIRGENVKGDGDESAQRQGIKLRKIRFEVSVGATSMKSRLC